MQLSRDQRSGTDNVLVASYLQVDDTQPYTGAKVDTYGPLKSLLARQAVDRLIHFFYILEPKQLPTFLQVLDTNPRCSDGKFKSVSVTLMLLFTGRGIGI